MPETLPTEPPPKAWLARIFADAVPVAGSRDPIKWMEKNVRLIGSGLSERLDFSLTPWSREPAQRAALGNCRSVTFVKPIQCGGSAAGEAVLCYWLATEPNGDVMYNWETNDKATARWIERFEKILKNCRGVMDRAPSLDRQDGKWTTCQVVFDHMNFKMQGVEAKKNLDSKTVRFLVNEEVHGWEPGRLAKAYGRITMVWNAIAFNISNAGKKGGQLHQKFLAGTQEHWEQPCPTCGEYAAMHTKFDPRKPERGGLRYDADGCRLPGGQYDYNKLAETIYYQMPCGHIVRDNIAIRRRMSMDGRYGPPQNPGAVGESSFILDAVSVYQIPWLTLIKEKHAAHRSLQLGDPEPWWTYLTERECLFVDHQEDRPVVGELAVKKGVKKARAGMPNKVARFAALDFQRGAIKEGEGQHWWLVIRDFDAACNSMLVYEGKLMGDADVVRVIQEHGVPPQCVVADSGDKAKMHVYQFCLTNGYNAIKGRAEAGFSHPDKSFKIFSPERPLYEMVNRGPTREDPTEEPLFWLYSSWGTQERLHWLRGSGAVAWDVPEDVSEDYRKHMENVKLVTKQHPKTGEDITVFEGHGRFDLYKCESYIAMMAEMAGLAPETIPLAA